MPAFLTAEEYLRKKGLVSGKEVVAKRYKFADRSDLLTLRNGKDGADGNDGKDGKDGAQGRDGRDGKDGAGFSWKGNWRESNTYSPGDVVNYLGSSYIALAQSKGDYPNRVNNNWDLMSAAGAAGARGPQGEVVSVGVPTFIQSTQPDYDGSYVWVQTGLGDDGTDYTVYYNIC